MGYNPKEENWLDTVWGTPPHRPGRLVKGVSVILQEDAEIAVISGGAIKEHKPGAQWMKELLYQRLSELKEFTLYSVFAEFTDAEIKRKLDEILRIESESQNTSENLENSAEILSEAGVDKTIIITSPDHISRALKDALVCWRESYPGLSKNVHGACSVTLYSARTPGDQKIASLENVIIAEPPVAKKLNFARLFGILGEPEALSEIKAVLEKYGR